MGGDRFRNDIVRKYEEMQRVFCDNEDGEIIKMKSTLRRERHRSRLKRKHCYNFDNCEGKKL